MLSAIGQKYEMVTWMSNDCRNLSWILSKYHVASSDKKLITLFELLGNSFIVCHTCLVQFMHVAGWSSS